MSRPKSAGITVAEAAAALNVSVRNVERARFIRVRACPEIVQAIADGDLNLHQGEKWVRWWPDHDRQLAELREWLKLPKKERPATWRILLASARAGGDA